MARKSAAKNLASSSGENVEVGTSFADSSLGFGLFKSVVDEIELGVGSDAAAILSANDAVEAT